MSAAKPLLILAAATGFVAVAAALNGEPARAPQPAPVRPEVGAPAAPGTLHLVRRPGLYGVSHPAPGTQYAIVGTSLVRIDTATHVVRSVIRGGVRPVD